MSVLETFYILFGSDADKVKKDAAAAEKATDDLEKKINSSGEAAKKLGDSFLGVARAAAQAAAAYLSFSAIKSGILEAAEYNTLLDKQAQLLRVNVTDLAAWSGAVQAAGGTAEGFQNTLRSLYERYAMFGGNVSNVPERLLRLADTFHRLNTSVAYAFGKRLGLDEGTILLLQKGRAEVEAMIKRQKELNFVTKEDTEVARKFKIEWDNVKNVFRSLFTVIGSEILPALTWIFKKIEDIVIIVREHRGLFYGVFAALALGMLVATVAAWGLIAPFVLLAAKILAIGAAFALIGDDIYSFLHGQESLIGDILNKWPLIGATVESLAQQIRTAWKAIGQAFDETGNRILLLWLQIKNAVLEVIGVISGAVNGVKSFFGFSPAAVPSETQRALALGQSSLALAAQTPLASHTSNSVANFLSGGQKETNIRIDSIRVDTQATDADGIAGAIGLSLQNQFRNTIGNLDTGEAY